VTKSYTTVVLQLLLEHGDFLNIDISQDSDMFKVWWDI